MYGKKRFPCNSYSGNLCGGFGGELICWICKWDKFDHAYRKEMLKEFVEKEYPKYPFDTFKSNHPDVEFTIKYNDYYDWWEVRFEGLMFEILRPTDDLEEMFKLCCQQQWKEP